jgi:hypothetical protein
MSLMQLTPWMPLIVDEVEMVGYVFVELLLLEMQLQVQLDVQQVASLNSKMARVVV